MRKTRLATAAAALAITGMALTGCSSGGSAKADSGSKTVSYMTWESNDTNKALDATMAKFTKSSGIKVTRQAAPNADYSQKLASQLMAKTAPDFFWCQTGPAQNLAAEGLLFDWSSYLNKDGMKKSDFAPGSLDMFTTPDGKLAGVPTLANTYGFFYNADTFQKAGIPVPKIGWTWDDLFSDLQKLKAADPKTTPLVNQWALLDSPNGVSAYSVANGGKPITSDFINTKTLTADTTFKKGAQLFADAIKSGEMTDPDYDATNAMAAFSNGSIPLMFGGQWLQQNIAPNNPKFSWGYAPWPVGSSGNVQPIEANGVCSPATLKNPEETWKTISYMETTGFNDTMAKVQVAPIAYTPGSKGYYSALEHGDAASKSIAATAKWELAAKDKFMTGFLDTWATKESDVVTTAWNPGLKGKVPMDKAVDSTVTGIEKIIQQQ